MSSRQRIEIMVGDVIAILRAANTLARKGLVGVSGNHAAAVISMRCLAQGRHLMLRLHQLCKMISKGGNISRYHG